MNKNIPNAISILRIILCIPLFFLPTMEPIFITIYIVAFLSDIVDGNLARITNTCSDLGKKLDSLGDFAFFLVFLFKIIPWMNLEIWALIWFIAIIGLRLLFFLWVIAMKCKFMPSHSIVNKITSFIIFIIPFFYLWIGEYCIAPALILASLTVFSDFNNARKLIKEQRPKVS